MLIAPPGAKPTNNGRIMNNCVRYIHENPPFQTIIFVSMRRFECQTEKDQLLGVLDDIKMMEKL